ncbi:MAG: cation:proton antiporter [Anaerolineae bacterium]|nr:MAG: cation:proton antiporter [Anaerolineae bacterium]
MSIFLQVLAWVFLIFGTLMSLIGVIGFVRLPDVYTRLHATGKVSVFGVVFLLLAADILTPLVTWKSLLLIFFVLMASPSVAHSIASAAYRTGIPITGNRDELATKLDNRPPKGLLLK